MLTANQINIILDALYQALLQKIPNLRIPSAVSIQGVKETGVQAALAFGFLFIGKIETKMTLILEWETAIKLAAKIIKVEKVDSFDKNQLEALETVMQDAIEKIMARFIEAGTQCEILPLPITTDSPVLLGSSFESRTLKIPILTQWQPILLYLSFSPPEEKHAA